MKPYQPSVPGLALLLYSGVFLFIFLIVALPAAWYFSPTIYQGYLQYACKAKAPAVITRIEHRTEASDTTTVDEFAIYYRFTAADGTVVEATPSKGFIYRLSHFGQSTEGDVQADSSGNRVGGEVTVFYDAAHPQRFYTPGDPTAQEGRDRVTGLLLIPAWFGFCLLVCLLSRLRKKRAAGAPEP